MAIRTVITRGFGNGTFNGTIALVVPRGYVASVVQDAAEWHDMQSGKGWTAGADRHVQIRLNTDIGQVIQANTTSD